MQEVARLSRRHLCDIEAPKDVGVVAPHFPGSRMFVVKKINDRSQCSACVKQNGSRLAPTPVIIVRYLVLHGPGDRSESISCNAGRRRKTVIICPYEFIQEKG